MIDRVAKGNRIQDEARRKLEAEGDVVQVVKKIRLKVHGRFISLGEDFFGAFDMMSTNPRRILFLQTTVPNHVAEKRHKIDALPFPPSNGLLQYQVWGWVKKDIWRVWRKTPDGWKAPPRPLPPRLRRDKGDSR